MEKFICAEKNLQELSLFCFTLLEKHKLKNPVFLLSGEMGAGKTTFVSSFVHCIDQSLTVNSPTYTLMNEYNTSLGTIYHFDLYRISKEQEIGNLGFEEIWGNSGISFVEWWKVAENYLLDKNCIEIEIFPVSLDERQFIISLNKK